MDSIEMFLVKTKSATPCADCGHYFPYFVMGFDHARGEKMFELSYAGGGRHVSVGRSGRTLAEVREEIAKCDLVCANCHAIRTFTRKADSSLPEFFNLSTGSA